MIRITTGFSRIAHPVFEKETAAIIHRICRQMSNEATTKRKPSEIKKDWVFCQPARLSKEELKFLDERRKELEQFNNEILQARQSASIRSQNVIVISTDS